MKRVFKRLLWVVMLGAVFVALLIAGCYYAVEWNAAGRTYDNVADVPHNRAGLLLATSPITPFGAHNYYFDNRVQAADELFKAGKVDFIIASGGDYTQTQRYGCDEPQAILDSLVVRGIPADKIILDYEGLRTLKSIEKAKAVYGLDSLTLISQAYHNKRALVLTDTYEISAVGYNAAESPIRRSRIRNALRELLARVKVFIDVYL